jgi:hypothetical protein
MRGEIQTEKGLRYFNYGFMIALVAYGIMIFLSLAILIALVSQPDEPQDFIGDFGLFGPFVWFSIGMAVINLIFLFSCIFFLVGIMYFSQGKWEFGPAHSNNNQKGILFLIIGFVIIIFGGMGFGPFGNIFGVVTAIMVSLGFTYMIQEITDESGKNMLRIGTIVWVVVSVIAAMITFWFFFMIFDPDPFMGINGFDQFIWQMAIPMATSTFSIIPLFLFFMVYRRTYFRVRNREIQPVPLPPPPMMPYYMGYPPYYPPYPPQYSRPPQQYPQPPPQGAYGGIGIKPMGPGSGRPADSSQGNPYETKNCVKCRSIIPKSHSVCPVCNTRQ